MFAFVYFDYSFILIKRFHIVNQFFGLGLD